jgi:hypothetical protein
MSHNVRSDQALVESCSSFYIRAMCHTPLKPSWIPWGDFFIRYHVMQYKMCPGSAYYTSVLCIQLFWTVSGHCSVHLLNSSLLMTQQFQFKYNVSAFPWDEHLPPNWLWLSATSKEHYHAWGTYFPQEKQQPCTHFKLAFLAVIEAFKQKVPRWRSFCWSGICGHSDFDTWTLGSCMSGEHRRLELIKFDSLHPAA